MIRVPFETMVFVYLFVTLSAVGGGWLWGIVQRRRSSARARRFRLRCARCAVEWEDRGGAALPKCPRCGTLNERRPPPTL